MFAGAEKVTGDSKRHVRKKITSLKSGGAAIGEVNDVITDRVLRFSGLQSTELHALNRICVRYGREGLRGRELEEGGVV